MINATEISKLKNVKLFRNDRETVEVKIDKETRVPALLSYFNSEAGYDLRVSPVVTAKSGRQFQKISLSVVEADKRLFFNGLLNPVKKEVSAYAYVGHLEVEGERIKVMIKHPEEGKSYYQVAFSKEAAPAPAPDEGASDSAPVPAADEASNLPF